MKMQSSYISFILGGMVVTGAARSIVAKLFYQLGFEHPLFLTLLYLMGQTFSLVPYNIWRYLHSKHQAIDDDSKDEEEGGVFFVEIPSLKSSARRFTHDLFTSSLSENKDGYIGVDKTVQHMVTMSLEDDQMLEEREGETDESTECRSEPQRFRSEEDKHQPTDTPSTLKKKELQGAIYHGLPEVSRTEHIVNSIPWYIKPLVPALFNLLNSVMRWASLVFVAASAAEKLISGMELVLSVLAARCVRGRRVAWVRWAGVAIVTIGTCSVGLIHTLYVSNGNDADMETEKVNSSRDQVIGIVLIFGQSVMSVIQDLSEELFMQEGGVPPALLMGMEGLYGLIFGLVFYIPIAPFLGEQPSDVANDLKNGKMIGLSLGWTVLVTITGIFNIASTGVTSSMTRNAWKNVRTCVIWAAALIIFYAVGNPELGEEWMIPESFYILISFIVMLAGIYMYGKG
mmetsp:Transcript_31292/g.64442  ORF Transcript_31292/g.64442 Transcript_31292/m.64442 type:complete len:456 (-) Transcript_31292:84-1451(-)